MFSEEVLEPFSSGPTILDLKVARVKAALIHTNHWITNGLIGLCKVHGIHTGSVEDSELLRTMLAKSYTQAIVHEGFGLHDLINLSKARGLYDTLLDESPIAVARSLLQVTSQDLLENQQDIATHVAVKSSAEHFTRLMNQVPYNRVFISEMHPKPSSGQHSQAMVFDPISEIDEIHDTLIAMLEQADHSARFNFLDLPAELRSMVYHLVCRASLTILHPRRQPAITKACRLTRTEALPIYYGHNQFAVEVYGSKSSWMRCISSTRFAWIRSFTFTDLNDDSILELDIPDKAGAFYSVRVRKVPGKRVVEARLEGLHHNGGHRLAHRRRCGGRSMHRITVGDELDNDGLATILGKPDLHEKDYMIVVDDSIRRLSVCIEKAISSGSEPNEAIVDEYEHYKKPGNHHSFSPPRLPSEEWKLFGAEWTSARGFTVAGFRALICVLKSESFLEEFTRRYS
ncbi:hypothetical protein AUEXF2481DRAFT_28039 [Aureobasidium subglaciale EXF-2481]|uniref:F-box domain-containing protein n=1 Tax=Aureobasidium subglaciale (strain EXF-2481) TaxID=1043005 RepID=A0A074YS23_AURSE|nr:uncharacterized protein AUEXF2481DRAFT_28039 [Aureobasidium subglaciale EXF-2481]KAI5198704.1 hypothetical protein E4T38_07393 [Aureobasidium subglaciale]KAI5217479.1 hypothetical protein E4T40_07404 [Aureobasidium subglaciale]KAI5221030.1 hypothetical protein E4T41_07245 [Aureobasidium subglaciale]KAI5258571.1 hypothetical protein E4T46_07222 [Aureobasidium subglaciale]KEQ96912.1 hypothetical protein AUEXF2481DRAFT_28039 [Aureobasidium subglaciale EXF-2481]